MQRERNLLVGTLAVAAGKAPATRLAEWSQLPDIDLADRLETEGLLTKDERATFDRMIDGALQTLGPKGVDTIASILAEDKSSAATVAIETGTVGPAATVLSADNVSLGPWKQAARGEDVPAVQEHPGRYDMLREFGSGGMGKILLVHDNHLGRDIALKTLLPDRFGVHTRGGAPTAALLTVPIIARFLQEARITGQLEHPAIVPVYELGYRDDGTIYYTMKLVRGRTMQDVLADAKSLGDRLALLRAFLDVCFAIAYAHSRGVIHRDLKPLNVMIGEFGETVVLDWGIAKVKGQEDIHARGLADGARALRLSEAETAAKTVYGQTMGSPYYMPPEQAAGKLDEIDERSDVYALGALLYHLLTGHPPYAGNTARQFLEKVTQFPPKPVRELEAQAPPELVAVCERAMAHDRKDRYADAKALATEIDRFISGGLVGAYRYTFSDLLKRFVRKHAKIIATAAVALVALTALGVYSYIRVTQERDVARTQRDLAVKAREAEEIAKREAEQRLYFANVKLAQDSIAEERMSQARDQLLGAPAEYRDWEWGHLAAAANADLMTIDAGGSYAAFAIDGRHLVTGSAAGTIEVIALPEGTRVRRLLEKAGATYAMAAGGPYAAAHHEKGIQVFDPLDGRVVFERPDAGAIETQRMIAISGDGEYVAALNSDKTARVWRVDGGAELFAIDAPAPQGFNAVFDAAPATHMAVTQTRRGDLGNVRSVALYALPGGEKLHETELPGVLSAHSMALSPDAAWLALGMDEGLQIWDTAKWEIAKTIDVRFGRNPLAIAFNGDGTRLLAGTADSEVLSIDLPSFEMRRADAAHREAIRAAAFTPGGRIAITASTDRTIKLWDAVSLRPLETLRGHDQPIFAVAIHPAAPLLATAAFDGTTRLWRLDRDLEHARPEKLAADLAHGLVAGALGNEAALWDARTGRRLHTLAGHTAKIAELALDPAGAALATVATEQDEAGAAAGIVRVWDTATGAERARFAVGNAAPKAIAFAGGATRLLAHAGTTLRVYDAATGAEGAAMAPVESFAVSADGARFAAAAKGENGVTVSVYGAGAAAPAHTFGIESKSAVRLAFSPDGAVLLAGARVAGADGKDAGRAYRWALPGGAALAPLEGHRGSIASIAFGPGGALATGGSDGAAVVWDAAAGTPLRTIEAHSSNVMSLAFSPDGARIATAGRDGTFKLWETATGRDILTVQSAALLSRAQALEPAYTAFAPGARALLAVTEPNAMPPVLLEAFPWAESAYAALPGGDAAARIEAFKRSDRGLAELLAPR